MTSSNDLPQAAGLSAVTYTITGLTPANMGNGIDPIALTGAKAPLSGTVNVSLKGEGELLPGVSLVVNATYTCA